ncbi:TetR family transcriptional regulator [Mesorhizobium sp. NBSH29]|uniref:TetR/AcrR family transcriptional regulator n=1 Tax=Mesorhizobium sp. NBSH29 TaxID=2654249 RepID=UPI0018968B0D|nr:TetR/AcrR family transcriptional regulator C-terminal domain-containing protein [Mesorhizobium sp. NBSH29]QPC86667.1 TetR family transcriptional regulator [Mesorhizobium sp. NBSH29]
MVTKRIGVSSKQDKRSSASPRTIEDENREPPLSLDRIVSTAVEMLDTDGVDRLSMRRLAERLGAGAMSLYWHVDNKDAVFDLALDSVLEYRARPNMNASQDWRSHVHDMLNDWRACMLRHPWSASLLPRRALGPSILTRLELLSCTLSNAGVPDAELNVAIWSLWNYVMGATVTRASFPDDKAASEPPYQSELYPTIERSRLLLDGDWDGAFQKGLGFLLDGLSPKP